MQFSSWLDERFIHDISARNNKVEQACFDHFIGIQELNIVDVGSGTGSTFLALYHKIPFDQNWTFLEQDNELILHSIKRIIQQLKQAEFHVEQNEKEIIFKRNGQTITLKTVNESLVNIADVIALEKIDLVTASAIFDLFSIEQYIAFDKILKDANVGILSAMNYTNMRFIPEDKLDASFIQTYHGHMCRVQDFGVGMGPNCRRDISAYYQSVNRKYWEGDSVWRLDPNAKTMHAFLLEYMDEGIHDMSIIPDNFDTWLLGKKSISENNGMTIIVEHFDYFVV